MNIDPALEGLWLWKSIISEGTERPSEPWHYLFRDGIQQEIVADMVDDGKLRSYYEVDLSCQPRRLLITLDYNGPNGPPDPEPVILRAVYEVDHDQLRITYGVEDEYPDSLSDAFPFSIKKFIREKGPIPPTKPRSNSADR